MSNLISKTDYLVWKDCPHNAWMKKWKPEIYNALPPSEFDQHLIDTGSMVEEEARKLYSGGIPIEGRDEGAVNKTRDLLEKKTATIYQASFSDDKLFAAVDILKQGKDGELYIYEVKASNSSRLEEGDKDIDEEHLFDLAFQVYLVRKAGYKVGAAYLVRLDKEYVRLGDIDLNKLFYSRSIDEYVEKVIPKIERDIPIMLEQLGSSKQPNGPCGCIYKGRSRHCTTFKYHNKDILKDVIDYSVHDLTAVGRSQKKLQVLIDSNVYDIAKISEEDIEMFGEKIQKQIRVHQRGKANIDFEAIRGELSKLEFPLYFLDYESFNPAIPRFDGYKPYQHIPFQFSLHKLDTIDSKLEEIEPFFYMEKGDPTPFFIDHLEKKIGRVGRIVVWNRTFEESLINKNIALRLPKYAEFINGVNSRIFDLMTIFSKQLHIHPDFHGSASIKKVLPVLCPSLSYKELEVGNGSEAMNTWNRLVTEDMTKEQKEELKQSMLVYCRLDTFAMYEIWKYLMGII